MWRSAEPSLEPVAPAWFVSPRRHFSLPPCLDDSVLFPWISDQFCSYLSFHSVQPPPRPRHSDRHPSRSLRPSLLQSGSGSCNSTGWFSKKMWICESAAEQQDTRPVRKIERCSRREECTPPPTHLSSPAQVQFAVILLSEAGRARSGPQTQWAPSPLDPPCPPLNPSLAGCCCSLFVHARACAS